MDLPKYIIGKILLIVAALLFIADYLDNRNLPEPYKFYDNYGFKSGVKIKTDPFDVTATKIDTLTVKAVKKGYVLFTNGETKRIGSIGMSWYEWEKVE
jgi:hypothetical protein